MNFKRLEVLVAIDQLNNITRAANHLNIKQPTVTFHMKGLEEETRTTLFQTHAGKTTLTHAGEALLFYAKKILYLAEDAKKTMEGLSSKEGYRIAIGSSTVPATYILPNIISRFKEAHPNLSISITVMTAPQIQNMLSTYSIDLGIISSSDTFLENIDNIKLCTDKMVLIYSKNSVLSKYSVLTKELLSQEKFILHTQHSTTRMLTDKWAKDIHLDLKPYVEINSTEAIKKAVMQNIGISILSELSVQDEIQANKLLYAYLPEYSPSRNIYVIFNKDKYMPPVLINFIDLLRNWDY